MTYKAVALIVTLTLNLLAAPLAAEGQAASRVPRIGYLVLSNLVEPPSPERQAFLDGLAELSYTVGHSVVIEYRSAAWRSELLPDLATELVELKTDVVLAAGLDAARAAKETITTIPVVMVVGAGDPVEAGLVASLARPGRNVTGLTAQAPELGGKRLELLKEAVRGLSRVAALWNPRHPGTRLEWRALQTDAKALGVTLVPFEVQGSRDFERAFAEIPRGRYDALLIVLDSLTLAHREIIAEFAARQRLPAIYGHRNFVDAGGLMSYGARLPDLYRRAATFVDKILKGAKPADLPVEQPTKFELVVNLKTAKALGLTIPPSVLVRADEVIE